MDIASAFTFPFQDDDWVKKIAIGAVLVLTGIGLIPVLGWSLAVSRRLIRDEQPLLPEWSGIGGFIVDGLKFMVIGFVWVLPMVAISLCLTGVSLAVGGAGQSTSQYGLSASSALGNVVSILSACIGTPYGLLLSFLLLAAFGTLADTGDLGRSLNPVNAFKLVRANIGSYLIAWIIGGLALMVLSTVGTIACVIGLLPATAYGEAVIGHLYGQAYKLAA